MSVRQSRECVWEQKMQPEMRVENVFLVVVFSFAGFYSILKLAPFLNDVSSFLADSVLIHIDYHLD